MQPQKQRDRSALIQRTADFAIHLSTAQTADLNFTIIKDVLMTGLKRHCQTISNVAPNHRACPRQPLRRQAVDRLTGCDRHASARYFQLNRHQTDVKKSLLSRSCYRISMAPFWRVSQTLSIWRQNRGQLLSMKCEPFACPRTQVLQLSNLPNKLRPMRIQDRLIASNFSLRGKNTRPRLRYDLMPSR